MLLIHRYLPRLLLSAALISCVILAAGCSEDEQKSQAKYLEVVAMVFDEMNGKPAPGVKLVLMEPQSNLPVAGPVVSDEYGSASFGILPEGDWRLLAFGGLDYRVDTIVGGLSSSGPAQTGLSPVSPLAKTSPPPIKSLQVMVFRTSSNDSLAKISGKVVDTSTGLPLDQVFVSLSPYLTGYEGKTEPSDDVTLTAGLYSVYQIPFTVNPVTGNIKQVQPLRFSRAGYRPVQHFIYPPNGHWDLDFRGVLIGMVPVAKEDSASISGRLVRDGAPVAGVSVGVGMADVPAAEKAGAGMPGWTGTTDAEGIYRITGLPAGTYFLQPGYAVGDGIFFPNQPNIELVEVDQGQAVEAKDLTVIHEITSTHPIPGAQISTPPDSLRWTPVPGAVRYEIKFNVHVLPPTESNAAYLSPDLITYVGRQIYSVLAYGPNSELLGATQTGTRFYYYPPD
jgi:hypothetical protein